MKERPYRIVGSRDYRAGCVVKITYNGKYVVAKCKDSFQGLLAIERGLNAFLRGGKNNPDGYFCHFYAFVKANPDAKEGIRATYLSEENDTPYQLLVLEQQALDAGRDDPNMLNNQTMAHIPPYDEATGLYGWLPPAAVLNYRNWLKRRKRARKTAG